MTVNSAAIPRPAPRPWVHFINDDFFDHPDMGDGLELLILRLERLAREKSWLISTNDELMALLRCSHNTLADLLKRGETLGWFRRVLITGRNGRASGRLGIVLLRRPTDRPVATPETFEQVVAQMKAASQRGNSLPRTLPFPPATPQNSGTAVPKNWAPPVPKNWVPPTYKEKETGEKTQKTTTTRDANTETPIGIHASLRSSSSFASLPQKPETPPDVSMEAGLLGNTLDRTTASFDASHQPSVEPGASAVTTPIPSARAERPAPAVVSGPPTAVQPPAATIELTPTVPARVLALPTEGIDSALLAALVARVVRLSAGFKVGPNWTAEQSRRAILGLMKTFGCPLWWIARALEQAEGHPRAKLGNKPVEGWGYVRRIVSNWTQGDGSPGSPPGAKPASPPGPPCPGPASRDRPPCASPQRFAGSAPEPALSELSVAELRKYIAETEATLAILGSSRCPRMSELLRINLSEAQSLLAAREGGS